MLRQRWQSPHNIHQPTPYPTHSIPSSLYAHRKTAFREQWKTWRKLNRNDQLTPNAVQQQPKKLPRANEIIIFGNWWLILAQCMSCVVCMQVRETVAGQKRRQHEMIAWLEHSRLCTVYVCIACVFLCIVIRVLVDMYCASDVPMQCNKHFAHKPWFAPF